MKVTCEACGAQMRSTARFCTGCGSALPLQGNLIRAAMAEDQEAYTALYRQAEKAMRMTVYAIVSPGSAENGDAEDILLDSMLKGFRSLEQLKNPDSFVPWMQKIARNRAIDYLRKNRELTFSELSSEEGEFEDTLVSENESERPELAMDQKARAELLREILTALPAEQRLALTMYYYHQMSIAEIAEELGCTEATVKSRLKYGKSKVEKQVTELQKKQGIKLYSVSPALLLVLLFHGAEQGMPESSALLQALLSHMGTAAASGAGAGAAAVTETAVGSGAAAAGTASAAGHAAAAAGLAAVKVKVAAGVVAAAIALGGGGYAVSRIAADRAPIAVEQSHTKPRETERPDDEDDLPSGLIGDEPGTAEPDAPEETPDSPFSEGGLALLREATGYDFPIEELVNWLPEIETMDERDRYELILDLLLDQRRIALGELEPDALINEFDIWHDRWGWEYPLLYCIVAAEYDRLAPQAMAQVDEWHPLP